MCRHPATHHNIPNNFKTQFSNPSIQKYYEHYRIHLVTFGVVVVWLLVVACIIVTSSLSLFVLHTKYDHPLPVVQVVMILRILLGCLALFVCYKISRGVPTDKTNGQFAVCSSCITKLTNALIIGFPLVNGLMLCWLASQGSCEEASERHFFFNCNTSYESGGVPNEAALFLITTNLFIISTLRCYSYWAILTCFVITIASTVVASLLSPNVSQSIVVVVAAFVTVIVGRGLEVNTYTMFKTLLDFQKIKRHQARELKHFIGNVAHDLRVRCRSMSVCLSMCLVAVVG